MNNHAKKKKKLKGNPPSPRSQRQITYLDNQLRAYGDFTLKTNVLGGVDGGEEERGCDVFKELTL